MTIMVGVPDHEQILREHGYHSLTVSRVVEETDDASSFVLEVPAALQETFAYQPGQFCTFRTTIHGKDVIRSYSMSSAPSTDAELTVTVKRVPGGLMSNWFNDHVHAGDAVDTTKPAGVFCPTERDAPVIAFCGGSGVTPVFSIVKHVLATTTRPVRMLYANRNKHSVIFAAALQRLTATHGDRLVVHHHFDADNGYLSPAAVPAFVGDDRDADHYICGPTPFMNLVEAALHFHGVDEDHIAIERFIAGGQPAEPVSATQGTPDELTLILKGKPTVVAYRPGDTVLDTARRGGLAAPYSCEAGNCATCMAFLRKGTATMRANNALSPSEVDGGWVLTCQALPTSPTVVVEYEPL